MVFVCSTNTFLHFTLFFTSPVGSPPTECAISVQCQWVCQQLKMEALAVQFLTTKTSSWYMKHQLFGGKEAPASAWRWGDGLDKIGFTSMHGISSGTSLAERNWTLLQSGVTLSEWWYEGVGQARQVLEILYIKTVKRISEKGSPGGVQQPSERSSTCCQH